MEKDEANDDVRALLTVDETCERLRIGKSTLYDLIREGKIKTVKIKRRRLISMDAISKFIRREAE